MRIIFRCLLDIKIQLSIFSLRSKSQGLHYFARGKQTTFQIRKGLSEGKYCLLELHEKNVIGTVAEILQKEPQENHDFGFVLHAVADELVGQFPPGGGFQCK